ncbi:hypothetical protein HK100_005719 [Physocladia obscura]|uniref:RING-type E3 ubiquitin transferase n=1 Tax=Physocladia obscura TaxID=109957 RepID=A0AAD5TBJ6_9FUNG|nr:hypothetical protein HK100_005719 [Physocladia obscura]
MLTRSIPKITLWIRRDLRAILSIDDVEIILEYSLAVFKDHDIRSDEATSLLRPYLSNKTAHFIHELAAFIFSGLTTDAYDAIVQYPVADQNDRDIDLFEEWNALSDNNVLLESKVDSLPPNRKRKMSENCERKEFLVDELLYS